MRLFRLLSLPALLALLCLSAGAQAAALLPAAAAAAAHGMVEHRNFTTHVVQGLPDNADGYNVYLPPGYDAHGSVRYPVLYLLHGWSQNEGSWDTAGHARETLDELIGTGRAKPMVVVMPMGYGDMSFLHDGFNVWQDRTAIDHNVGLFEQSLLSEVLPEVERTYKVRTDRDGRALAGLSMGGLEALVVGLNNTGKFAYLGGFSSAVHLVTPETLHALDPRTADLKLLWIACGTDDGLLGPNEQLVQALQTAGLKVTAVETPGAHVWPVWRRDLREFLPLLFAAQ